MTKLEIAEKEHEIALLALDVVTGCAKEDQRVTNASHFDVLYIEAIGRLESKVKGAQAYITRLTV